MIKILDQNRARSPKLDCFLNQGNKIVLTDDFLLEPMKSSNVGYTVDLNLEILRKYPDQILVTFDRGELIRKEFSQGSPLISAQLISAERTEIIKDLLKLDKSSFGVKIENLEYEAADRLAYQDNFLDQYIKNIAIETSTLMQNNNETKEYRENKSKKLEDIKKVSFEILELTLKEKSKKYHIDSFINNNSIIFSQIFIHLWRIVDWAIKGGAKNARKGIKGDAFDIKYVLISCFFDGILTKETWLDDCRSDTLSQF